MNVGRGPGAHTMAQRDYYEVLGVPKNADNDTIKRAYRKLAMQYHPDRNQGDEAAAEKFKEAAEAYSVLSDGEKRQRYDQFGHAGVQGGPGGGVQVNIEDILSQFGDIFGGRGGSLFETLFGFGGGGRGGARGRSLRVAVAIEMEEVLTGTERTIALKRGESCSSCQGSGAAPGSQVSACSTCGGQGQVLQQQGFFTVRSTCPSCRGEGRVVQTPCPTCKGQGRETREREIKVKIPAGIESGAQIRLSGEGESGEQGAPAGDLFVEVQVKEHPRFHREERDLYVEVPLSYGQAVLGDKLRVKTLEGEARMSIPAGTPTGKLFRLRSQGLPRLHGGSRGDLFVRVYVDVPSRPGKEEKNLIKKLFEIEKAKRQQAEKSR